MTQNLAAPDLLIAANTTLQALTFPAHDAQTADEDVVEVVFMDTNTNKGALETVELVGAIGEGEVEWASSGAVQAEVFLLTIVVSTRVPGQTGIAALNRVNALGKVVQDGFRDITTGQPKGLHESNSAVIRSYRVAGFRLDPIVLADQGYGFEYELTLRVSTRV